MLTERYSGEEGEAWRRTVIEKSKASLRVKLLMASVECKEKGSLSSRYEFCDSDKEGDIQKEKNPQRGPKQSLRIARIEGERVRFKVS